MKSPEDTPIEAVADQQGSGNVSTHSLESEPKKSDRVGDADTAGLTTSPTEEVGEIIVDIGSQAPVTVSPEELTSASMPAEDTKESISLMKAITNLWADRSAGLWKPLDYPLYGMRYILLTPGNHLHISSPIPT